MYLEKKAFTLFELIVAISIVMILMMMTFAPYSYFQNKAKLKLSAREISQSFYEARNMAVSWIKDINWNKSIWIYMTTNQPDNNKIIFFSYPYNIDENSINNIELWDTKILKIKLLQDGIKINDLWGSNSVLFFYNSIYWESKIYSFDTIPKTEITLDEISIIFSFKNATTANLRKELIYFKGTNIVDYK